MCTAYLRPFQRVNCSLWRSRSCEKSDLWGPHPSSVSPGHFRLGSLASCSTAHYAEVRAKRHTVHNDLRLSYAPGLQAGATSCEAAQGACRQALAMRPAPVQASRGVPLGCHVFKKHVPAQVRACGAAGMRKRWLDSFASRGITIRARFEHCARQARCRAATSSAVSTYLESITIADFALVAQQTCQFGPGLTVISGESGSGKSVLLAAFNMILGGQASSDLVRSPSDLAGTHVELRGCAQVQRMLDRARPLNCIRNVRRDKPPVMGTCVQQCWMC